MSRPAAEAFAAAKVNLFLHVGPRGHDGYHPVETLILFADLGDRLLVSEGDGLSITGPFADALSPGPDNLVLRARDALGARDVGLTLDKQLPLAAGLGGGSADAAATLRLLNARLARPKTDAELLAIAASLGSDVAACLQSRPVFASGRGEVLSPAPPRPPLDAVLVNPGVASPTAAVYQAFDERGAAVLPRKPWPDLRSWDAGAVASAIAMTQNDLEPPAILREPAIGAALALLSDQPEALAVRVSGSGATCFAICTDAGAARALAGRLSAEQPTWWVRACRLGGPWGDGAGRRAHGDAARR